LPDCAIELIFSHLSYDELAKARGVNRKFNDVAKSLLNHGFYKLLNCHAKHLKRIKAQLPRRESERSKCGRFILIIGKVADVVVVVLGNHPLSKFSDILTCIETRLSMLSMTYQKYIQNGTACFVPGRVIDECYRILRMISATAAEPPAKSMRAHEVLQELRDISSMAIEHFDEKIAPDIKKLRENPHNVSIYDILQSPRPTLVSSSSYDLLISRNALNASVAARPTKTKLSSVVNLYRKQSKIIKMQSKQISKMKNNIKQLSRRLFESEIKTRELNESIKQLNDNTPGTSKPAKRTATKILKRILDS